jgi:flagellar biosynthesis/type III secretory pathway protein FliH
LTFESGDLGLSCCDLVAEDLLAPGGCALRTEEGDLPIDF